MAKRVSHKDSMCGVARPLDAIGDWWSLLIIRDAFDGLRRFGEFQKSLGLAKNFLAAAIGNMGCRRRARACFRCWWRFANGATISSSNRMSRM